MPFSVLGLATALPEHTMSVAEAIEMSSDCICRTERQDRLLRTMFRRAEIENRHLCVPFEVGYQWVPVPARDLHRDDAESSRGPTTGVRMQMYAEHAAPLALRTAASALRKSRLPARAITHLVTVSCTGFEAPGVDVELIDRLQLRPTVERVHVGFMGCHGAINGMRAALAFTGADSDARVLLCATELCSLHFCCTWNTERMLGNALFADGSAALVCGPSDGDNDSWNVVATGSCLMPDSRDAITWRIGDHGYEMSLSSRVPELISTHLRPWLSDWLASQDLTIGDIGSWAIHPGGPRILDAVEECLELPRAATRPSREVLRQHGNMSSPTILFIIERLRRQQARRPCVALGFGPGLAGEAVLIR